jgi:RimJ/RimL family protein N-acetyltransferase
MNQKAIAAIVSRYRSTALEGQCVRLVPYEASYGEQVRALRNTERGRYNLAQLTEISAEMQRNWYEQYRQRTNDLTWVILNRRNEFIGGTALYEIDPNSPYGEKGRLILDEKKSLEAPYALEAELMLVRFYFDQFPFPSLMTRVRTDNEKMISMNQRFGFTITGPTELRGVPYCRMDLHRGDFQPFPFEAILSHWAKRYEPKNP